VYWPKASFVGLGGIGGVDDGGEIDIGFFIRMIGSEGDVVRWVPVLRGNFEGEWEVEEFINGGYDIASIRNCKGTVLG
jgi:hypothetical protein